MKKFEEYYIGLDMGTGSVGWAVTGFSVQYYQTSW